MKIGTIPDDVLLEIFNFYMDQRKFIHDWFRLAHVCQRWRYVVSVSPRRLNLQLVCNSDRSAKEMLVFWPAASILLSDYGLKSDHIRGINNILTALECNDRLESIDFHLISSSLMEVYVAMMQVSFPELESLGLAPANGTVSILSDSFLGGSAPRLQVLHLERILFPALPNLLLSTNDLTILSLLETPHSGYIPPQAMVTCLSFLIKLDMLHLGFLSPRSRPDKSRRRPAPLTRIVLSDLTSFEFRGVSEYLEELVAGIDAPLLEDVRIIFFNQLIFDAPRFRQFLSRANHFDSPDHANVTFYSDVVVVSLSPPMNRFDADDGGLSLQISCTELDWQLSSVAQICNSSFPSLSTLERLYVRQIISPRPQFQVDMENTQWLELFHRFTTVKDLYLSKEFVLSIVHALHDAAEEMVTEVLPALQNIHLDGLRALGPILRDIGPFIEARQLSGHPVAVSTWERDW